MLWSTHLIEHSTYSRTISTCSIDGRGARVCSWIGRWFIKILRRRLAHGSVIGTIKCGISANRNFNAELLFLYTNEIYFISVSTLMKDKENKMAFKNTDQRLALSLYWWWWVMKDASLTKFRVWIVFFYDSTKSCEPLNGYRHAYPYQS